jgi:hypothetical protein
MANLMTFDPVAPAIGGVLIGLGGALLMLLNGRCYGFGHVAVDRWQRWLPKRAPESWGLPSHEFPTSSTN